MSRIGFLYAMTSPSYRMPWRKVGKSRRVPDYRAADGNTALPDDFEIEYYALFQDVDAAEREAHQRLRPQHYSKEFFLADLNHIVTTIESIPGFIQRVFCTVDAPTSSPSSVPLPIVEVSSLEPVSESTIPRAVTRTAREYEPLVISCVTSGECTPQQIVNMVLERYPRTNPATVYTRVYSDIKNPAYFWLSIDRPVIKTASGKLCFADSVPAGTALEERSRPIQKGRYAELVRECVASGEYTPHQIVNRVYERVPEINGANLYGRLLDLLNPDYSGWLGDSRRVVQDSNGKLRFA